MTDKRAIQAIQEKFPQLKSSVRGHRLVYLDNAATTLMPREVSEKISKHDLELKANVHRGAHYISDLGTRAYEDVRLQVAQFLGARSANEVVFTKGTTESLNLVATSFARSQLQPGDEILITEMEHHSNIVPWQMVAQEKGLVLKIVPVDDSGTLDLESLAPLLTRKTKLVSLVYCSNTLGTVNPVRQVVQMAHDYGARVVVDAAQAVSAFPINVQELGCDFLAFSGHKLFGPFGVGVLWGREELLASMPPYQTGGSMISSVTFAKTDFLPPPQRFEAGTPNVSGVVGLGAAIDFLGQMNWQDIAKHEQSLLIEATQRLADIDGVRFIGTAKNKISILSFVIEGFHPSDMGQILDQQGIAIRTGHHCTQPLMTRYGISGTLRASFSIYNDQEDVSALYQGVLKAKELLQ